MSTRDIAARNMHLFDNSVVKISLIDNSRDIYPDDYFRLPGFNESLPVRWLAPEVIQQQQWSSKSDVWSFGCLMWEVFSGGQRPYTGFVDQEVIGLVTSGHVLSRPDRCPAIVYDVMTECWKRPSSSRADMSSVCRRLASCQKPLMEAEKRGRPMGVGDQHPAIPGNPLQMTTSSTNPVTRSGEYQVEHVIDGPNKTIQSNSVYKYTPASLGGGHACRQEGASLGGVHACRQEDGEDLQFARHPTVLCGSTGKNFEILYRTSAGDCCPWKPPPLHQQLQPGQMLRSTTDLFIRETPPMNLPGLYTHTSGVVVYRSPTLPKRHIGRKISGVPRNSILYKQLRFSTVHEIVNVAEDGAKQQF